MTVQATTKVSLVNKGPQVRLTVEGQAFSARLSVASPTIRVQPMGARGERGLDGASSDGIDWSPPSAQSVWLIPHNLGHFPQVMVMLPDGEQVGAKVEHLDINTVSITFAAATSGTAHLT
jgi:hypothetical protein